MESTLGQTLSPIKNSWSMLWATWGRIFSSKNFIKKSLDDAMVEESSLFNIRNTNFVFFQNKLPLKNFLAFFFLRGNGWIRQIVAQITFPQTTFRSPIVFACYIGKAYFLSSTTALWHTDFNRLLFLSDCINLNITAL